MNSLQSRPHAGRSVSAISTCCTISRRCLFSPRLSSLFLWRNNVHVQARAYIGGFSQRPHDLCWLKLYTFFLVIIHMYVITIVSVCAGHARKNKSYMCSDNHLYVIENISTQLQVNTDHHIIHTAKNIFAPVWLLELQVDIRSLHSYKLAK